MSETNFEDCLPLRGRWLLFFLNGLPVVVLLLGVGLVWPQNIICRTKGPVGCAKTQIGNFKTALERYRLDHGGRCPTTREGLRALITEPTGARRGRWRAPHLTDVI